MFNRTAYLRVYMKKWRAEHPDRVKLMDKRKHLKKRYGITIKDLEEMLILQNNKCALCQEDLDNKPTIDHNHKTGKIRGLIHKTCNFLLGNAKDDIKILRKAIKYLQLENSLKLNRKSN